MPRARNGAVELEYETFGDVGGRPLLLVMGLGAQMIAWREAFCAQLAAAGHFVIRYDNRDTGLSTRFDDHPVPSMLELAPLQSQGEIVAQVIGTGPTLAYSAMTACFSELIHAARDELVITTPYFVPDDPLLYALLSAARRGVKTLLILPAKNDSRIVAAASRSHYADLLKAGVELYEYRCGLLHAKTMIVDGKVGLVGSANLDRRSFELNFENNILFADETLAAEIRARQNEWLADSNRVTPEQVAATTILARLWQNTLAMFGPLL